MAKGRTRERKTAVRISPSPRSDSGGDVREREERVAFILASEDPDAAS